MFQNRKHAAHLLAKELVACKNSNAVIVAMPHGGVPVGYNLAVELHLPLEVIPHRRIQDVSDSHHSIGSVSLEGAALPGENLDFPQDYIYHQVSFMKHRLHELNQFYYQDRKPMNLRGKTVILVDDLIKTESEVLACLRSIRKQTPEKIIVAVPVATWIASQRVIVEADDSIFLETPFRVEALSDFYEYAPRVSDDDIRALLFKAEACYENGSSVVVQD